jgi:hypothetical protein
LKITLLSSTEVEYLVMSECARGMEFVHQLLPSMGVKVVSPIVVGVYNAGAMFMGENMSISQRTKHVDVRAKFVTKMMLDKFLKVIFVKSEDNDFDIFTKNLQKDLHDKKTRQQLLSRKDPSEWISGEMKSRGYVKRKLQGRKEKKHERTRVNYVILRESSRTDRATQ